MKKPKLIHLSEKAIQLLSIKAIYSETTFKNYVENILEKIAIEPKNRTNEKDYKKTSR